MSEEVAGLMRANLHRVFSERDDSRRRAAIASIFTEDVVFTDPDGTGTGRDALDEKVRSLLDASPELMLAEDGPSYTDDNGGCLPWRFGPEGQPPALRGIDIVSVRDGRIDSVKTLFVD